MFFCSETIKAETAVTLRKSKKIAILALTPTINLTQTLTLALTLTLILTQAQNLIQTLTLIKNTKNKWANEPSLFALLFAFWALRNVTQATSNN